MARSKEIKIGLAAGFCTAFIWGAWPVITRFGVTSTFSPTDIIAVRFLFASLILLPFYLKSKVYQRVSPLKSLALSAFAGGLYVFIASSALQYIPAGNLAAMMSGTMMILSAIGGYALLNEEKTWGQILGYGLIIFGIIALNFDVLLSAQSFDPRGFLLAIAGGTCWACFTISSKYWKISPWDGVSSVSLYSFVIWTPLLISINGFDLLRHSWESWAFQGISQGVVTAIIGLWVFSVTIQKLGAGNGALFAAIVPLISVFLSIMFLNEFPNLQDMVGVVLASCGMALALKPKTS